MVQSSGSEQCLVHDFRPVGGSNDEDVLFGTDTVHLGQKLVDHSVSSSTSIALASASGNCNGVQLVEEKHAGCGSSCLIEHISDVCLALSEPHGQQFRSLDGDEVGTALVGDCLGEQGLAASGRTVEEDSLRGLHAELVEFFGVFDREEDHLLKLFLGLFEASDVLPLDVGHFDVGFTQGGGVDRAHGELEVFLTDGHSLQDLGVDLVGLDVDDVHLFADALQRGFSAEGGHVCAHETVGVLGHCLQVDCFVQFHVFGVDAEDFQSADLVRDSDVDFPVEPAEAAQGGIEGVGSVGGSNDDDVSSGLEAVHEGQQLRDHSALDFTVHLLSVGRDRVDLVDEDNGRAVLFCLLEGLPQVAFCLASHLRHDLRAVDEEEEGAGLVGDCPGDECLS